MRAVRPVRDANATRPPTWDQDRPLDELVDIEGFLAAARRQWRAVAVCVAASLALGVVYLFGAKELYTAGTSILVDQSSAKLVEQLADIGTPDLSTPEILSQIEVIRSEGVALAVVDALGVADDPSFLAGRASLLASIKSVLSSGSASDRLAPSEDERRLKAMRILLLSLDVSRLGDSLVLNVSYVADDPVFAARVANAFADAYVDDQFRSNFEATRRASGWLEERIEEVRRRSVEANAAVQRYRTEHGLVAPKGELLSDQQLSEISSQLVAAEADTAEAKAKYDRIEEIIDSGQTDALVTDALQSTVINDLRTKYLDVSRRQAEVTAGFSAEHPQAVRLRTEMREYERQIREELARIAQSYWSEYQVAMSREQSLRVSLDAATGASAANNQMLADLGELEQVAETYNVLYQSLLERHQEAVQQQSFPVSETRVITRAAVPTSPSHPKTALVLALAGVIGAAFGVGAAGYREFRDRFFRTGEQVRGELNLDFFGFVPLLPHPPRPTDGEGRHPRAIMPDSLSGYVIKHPLSAFAEPLRSAKIAADIALEYKRPSTIGIISTLPREGKSVIAANFAELLASQGAKTLLIDGDLRNPGLTRNLAPQAETGLVECILEGVPIREVLLLDPKTKLAFIPGSVRHRVPHTSDMLASASMTSVLSQASRSFEYVVIDLPPFAPVVDVRAIASKVDAFILVIAWGSTPRRIVRSMLQAEPIIAGKCLGAILNKVDEKELKRYGAPGSTEQYLGEFAAYYRNTQ